MDWMGVWVDEEAALIAEHFKYSSKASPVQPCGFNTKNEFRRATVMTWHGWSEAIDLLYRSVQGSETRGTNPHCHAANHRPVQAQASHNPGYYRRARRFSGRAWPTAVWLSNDNEAVSKFRLSSERTMHRRTTRPELSSTRTGPSVHWGWPDPLIDSRRRGSPRHLPGCGWGGTGARRSSCHRGPRFS